MELNGIKNKIDFFEGGGEMGELVRNFDWEKNPLGHPDNWPLTLKSTLGIVLHSAFPQFMFWGEDLISFYNDPFKPSLGVNGKHPAIGKKGKDVWPEIWEFIGPLIEKVMTTGESVFFEDQLVPFFRNGRIEDIYWTFSYSPAYGDDGKIAGVFVTCTETTGKIKAITEVKESRNQLQFAIDAADLGTWELNPVTNTFKGNTRLKEWFGLKPEEEIPLPLALNVIAEKDRENVIAEIAKALTYESGGNYDVEYMIQNPHTGKEIIVKAKGRAYFDEEKKPYTFSGTLQDVTEEAKHKKTINGQRNPLRGLIEDAPVATCVLTGKELKIELANEMMLALWNRDRSIIGKPLKEALSHINVQSAIDKLTRVYTTGEPYNEIAAKRDLEINGVKKTFYFNLTYKPLFNEQREVYGIMDMAVDVTEQILIQKRTEESELFSRDVFYSSPVAKIVFTGNDMVVARVNENMLNILGRDESIIGKPFMEAMPELLNSPLLERMQEVYATGKTFSMPEEKIRLIRHGKHYTGYYSYVYKPLVSTTGEIYGIMSTATEITEQVVARQKIEAKEKELRDLITAAPIGICVVSGDPVYVEEVNDRFLIISGKTREQFASQPYWDVIPEVAHIFAPILNDVFKTGVKYTTEENEMVLVRDGVPERIILTFEYIPVFDIDNKVSKVIVMAVEVTHQVETRKKIEDAVILRTQELAESNLSLTRSNQELEQFAYIASHDLQEPIRKISTFTQMLEMSMQGLSEKSKDYISKIYSSTDRMTKLIRDVLAFSRVAHETDQFEKIDLTKILEAVIADFDLLIEKKEATIEVANLPLIEAMPSQISQLFGNLMSNSLKYTRPDVKPVITISASIAKKEKIAKHPSLDINKKYYHIEFSDNGIGFGQEHAERIFRIFQRLHGKTEFEGTGIGLSICQKIVQNHFGHISAAAGKNGGALFNILLPEGHG